MNTRTFSTSFIILLASLISIFLVAKRGEPRVVTTNLENLPMAISGYTGTEDSFPDSVYQELNADRHVYRHYRAPDGTKIDLYIGYYGTAKGGRTGHNPYACLPGAGWGIIGSQKIKVPFRGSKVAVNSLVARRGNAYETVIHWYQSDKDKVLATGTHQNIRRFMGRIISNRNDGAFVRLSMQTRKEEVEFAKEKLNQFTAKLLSVLPYYWPEER